MSVREIDETATRGAAAELVALHRELAARGESQANKVIERAEALLAASQLHPAILGEIFEKCLAHPERHAHGVHFTNERDVEDVIGPTITGPWRRRIAAARTEEELLALHAALREYSVLDPACGSGNFLYAAFVALTEIEAELRGRLREVGASEPMGRVRARQCRGIDRSVVAAGLARVTLRIAEVRAGGDGDAEIAVGDALFMPWGAVDAIVGNPPFIAKNKLVPELGRAYVERLRAAYPEVSGRADYCVYFFRKAHDSLGVGGRAGLIGTNTIRQNDSRAGGLGYIVENGGQIVDAVGSREWAGEAAVHVSVVNWVKGAVDETRVLDGVEVKHIGASLSALDLTGAVALGCNKRPKNCFQGQTHGCDGFLLEREDALKIGRDERARRWVVPYLNGDDLLGAGEPTRFAIDLSDVDDVRIIKRCKGVYRWIEEAVLPEVRRKAEGDPQRRAHLATWWKFWRPRAELAERLRGLRRYIVCVRVTKRPIFAFVDAGIRPSDALQAFTFDDDYSFGVLQSRLHWDWFNSRCSTLKADYRYTSESVWGSFPWPQAPTAAVVLEVAAAARALRAERVSPVNRRRSLRAVYRSLESGGEEELASRQRALDEAVRQAYGLHARADGLMALLRLNAEVAAEEKAGRRVQGPGLPEGLRGDGRLRSRDRVRCVLPWAAVVTDL